MSEDRAESRLASYGSLAPGRTNHHELAALSGNWRTGTVRGHVREIQGGPNLGYLGLALASDGSEVEVHVFESDDLPAHWDRLDSFEGPEYRRVVATVTTAEGPIAASIYTIIEK